MRNYLYLFAIAICCCNCCKKKPNTTFPFGALNGKIKVLPNEFYSGAYKLNHKVLKLYDAEGQSFFISSPINDENEFQFVFQRHANKNYFFNHTDTFGNLIYKVDSSIRYNANDLNITLQLMLDTLRNNILSIEVLDSTGLNSIENAVVQLYKSKYLADLNKSTYMLASETTKNGKATFIGLQKDSFFANVSVQLNNDSIFQRIAKPIDFTNGRIVKDTLRVGRK
jgi:hypothetical protein